MLHFVVGTIMHGYNTVEHSTTGLTRLYWQVTAQERIHEITMACRL